MRGKKPLWAPWRREYIGKPKAGGCVFCRAAENPEDPDSLVVAQKKNSMAVLNRYPYASGHLMVIPKRHVGAVEELTGEEASELWELFIETKKALDSLFAPEGYNAGLNMGKAAGAGIGEHIHFHLVPRWSGDSNFMPVLADIRVMPEHLLKTWSDLKKKMGG
jgi:ATP adenylyltransferase